MERQALVSSAAPNDPNWEEVDTLLCHQAVTAGMVST